MARVILLEFIRCLLVFSHRTSVEQAYFRKNNRRDQ
jgi:hypothetical protein